MKILHHIKSSFGSVQIFKSSDDVLIARPSGLISYRMIKEDFEFVNNYPVDGFDYYVDLTGFVIPNPFNLYYLRKLHSIPKLNKYTIVTDNPILQLMIAPIKGVLKYEEVIGYEAFEKRIGN